MSEKTGRKLNLHTNGKIYDPEHKRYVNRADFEAIHPWYMVDKEGADFTTWSQVKRMTDAAPAAFWRDERVGELVAELWDLHLDSHR